MLNVKYDIITSWDKDAFLIIIYALATTVKCTTVLERITEHTFIGIELILSMWLCQYNMHFYALPKEMTQITTACIHLTLAVSREPTSLTIVSTKPQMTYSVYIN